MGMLIRSLLVGFCLGLSGLASAQTELSSTPVSTDPTAKWACRKYRSYIVIGGSAQSYRGNLSNSYRTWQPGLHVGIQLNRKRIWNGQFTAAIGTVSGSDPFYLANLDRSKVPTANPNNFFNTSFFTAQYQLQLNLFNRPSFRAYVYQGVGFMSYTVRDAEGNDLANIRSTRASGENLSTNGFLLPMGIGANYFLDNGWGLGLNLGWVNPMTEYIDNINQASNSTQRDNLLQYRFHLLVPFTLKRK